MSAILVSATLLFAPTTITATPFEQLWSGWEKVDEDAGIRVFKKESPDSPILAFGGDTVIEAPLELLCSVLTDVARMPEWVDSLAQAKVLDGRNPYEFMYYHRYSLPWPMSDRDMVLRESVMFDPESHILRVLDRSVDAKSMPDQDCCVRAQTLNAEVQMVPVDDKRTAVAALARVDMKGSLPVWLVNVIQEDFPRNTFKGYRTQLSKPNLKVLPACQRLLAPVTIQVPVEAPAAEPAKEGASGADAVHAP